MEKRSISISILIISILVVSLSLIIIIQESKKSDNENIAETGQILLNSEFSNQNSLSGLSFLNNEDDIDSSQNSFFGGGSSGGGSKKSSSGSSSSNSSNSDIDYLNLSNSTDSISQDSDSNEFAEENTTEGLDELEQDPNVSEYKDILPSSEFIQPLLLTLADSVSLINADDVWDLGITGKGSVICVVGTGIDYTHPDLGNCSNPYNIKGDIFSYSLESPPFCPDGYNETWTITKEGFDKIAVHFSEINLRNGDEIFIRDGNGNEVQKFDGNHKHKNVWSVSVPGDTIKINLVIYLAHESLRFAIDKILNGTATFSLDDCEKVIDGYDFDPEYTYDIDPIDHSVGADQGTYIAGFVAANGNIKGVAPDAKLLAVKVGNTISSVADGFEWCSDKKEEGMYNIVAIITKVEYKDPNGFCSNSGTVNLDNAIDRAHDLGIAVISGSGRQAPPYDNRILYPACLAKTISVGSTAILPSGDSTEIEDGIEVISSWTNTDADLLNLLAPGDHIYSTITGDRVYAFFPGTRAAAAHVAGAIALLKQPYPSASPDQMRDILKSTGIPIYLNNTLSFPRIDVLAAANSFIECYFNSECDDSNPYTEDVCYNASTADSQCVHLKIDCLTDIDCGDNHYMGNLFCQNNDVWLDYVTYKCNIAGTSNSYCSNSTTPKLIKECPDGCTEGRCKVKVCSYGKCYYF